MCVLAGRARVRADISEGWRWLWAHPAVRTLAITIGAGQCAGLQGSASYAGAPTTGIVMGGTGVARVETSNDPSWLPRMPVSAGG